MKKFLILAVTAVLLFSTAGPAFAGTGTVPGSAEGDYAGGDFFFLGLGFAQIFGFADFGEGHIDVRSNGADRITITSDFIGHAGVCFRFRPNQPYSTARIRVNYYSVTSEPSFPPVLVYHHYNPNYVLVCTNVVFWPGESPVVSLISY
jgi:hypothetical protein